MMYADTVKTKIDEDIEAHKKEIDELEDVRRAIEAGQFSYKVEITTDSFPIVGESEASMPEALGIAFDGVLGLSFSGDGEVHKYICAKGRFFEVEEGRKIGLST
jgi:hypothetical protein